MKISGEYAYFSLPEGTKATDPIVSECRKAFREGRAKAMGAETWHNLIPTVGRDVFARLLCGDTTYSGEINYGAIGNGATPAFTNASTKLVGEAYRLAPASQVNDNNIAYIDWFIAAGDLADGTYTEWGSFIDGTAAADSGRAFSLSAKTLVKSGSMFIAAKYTIS